jgi:Putative peptidoglycan binding domain
MERLTILAVCLISALAIVTPAVDGQTNAPVVQNGSQGAATGRSHTSNMHPNAPISRNIARGPVSVGPRAINSLPAQMVGQRAMNLRPNYSQFMRPLNPTLAEMSARHVARPDSVQPSQDVLPRSENVQRTMPTASAQRVVAANNLKPISGDLARREISEGLETVNGQRIARNNNLKPISGDLANREPRQRMAKWNHQTGKNRFSYSDALRRNRREWHDRNWWRQHCNTIVFVSGGYYFLDGSYWYPAWGYDPLNNYYDYDGPVYTYGNLLPDEVIANVQVALQEAGYYGGPITGSLSVETRAALANYQRDQGLLITGAIDEPTIESLGLY